MIQDNLWLVAIFAGACLSGVLVALALTSGGRAVFRARDVLREDMLTAERSRAIALAFLANAMVGASIIVAVFLIAFLFIIWQFIGTLWADAYCPGVIGTIIGMIVGLFPRK